MPKPIMPMATAIWLVDNTSLTFEQIAEFCELHILQVRGIADGEVATNILSVSPLDNSQLTHAEITRCEGDPTAKIRMNPTFQVFLDKSKKKTARYTPVARRQNKPDAISWIVKHYPEITDGKIIKLIGTTKKTIQAIRDKSHWNFVNITPKDPVLAGFCSQQDMNKLIREVDDIRERIRIRDEDAIREEGGSVTPGVPQSMLSSIGGLVRPDHEDAPSDEDQTPEDDSATEEEKEPELSAAFLAREEKPDDDAPKENPLKAAEQLFAKFGGSETSS